MKIYVSGTYSAQARLREQATRLFHLGHNITSTWLNEVMQPKHVTLEQWFAKLAIKDLAEVAAADCIILDKDGQSTTGGRFVEWGFATGRFNMLKVIVGGSTLGVFDTLADEKFTTWDGVVKYFEETHSVRP